MNARWDDVGLVPMTAPPARAPADVARDEGRPVVALVTHTFHPGHRTRVISESNVWRWSNPDPERCARCGSPESHRYHGGTA